LRWSSDPVESTPSPVNAVVNVVASWTRFWQIGMAKFAAIQPNTRRGTSSPTP
jgi:hypothetical protein